jgi:hypothetical protein
MVLCLVVAVVMGDDYSRGGNGSEEKVASDLEPRRMTAGLSKGSSKATASKKSKVTTRPKVTVKAGPRSEKQIVESSRRVPQITVTKSGDDRPFDRKASKPSWRFLDRLVRAKIDSAKVSPRRWKMMVLHSSATTCGSARAFDYYHRKVKHMEQGLAYHFVIGNGHGSRDGQVEVGARWLKQIAGGHLKSESQNEIALGICLVGNYEKNRPTAKQIEALDELIDYLQAKLGKIKVTTHRLVNVRPTLCPGKYFPSKQFVEP